MASKKSQVTTRYTDYVIAGSIVIAKQQITAVPADGRSTKVRIPQGTTGIVDEGSVPGIAPGDPHTSVYRLREG